MDDDRTSAIARRAYELWEQSDRAHGRHDEHWRRAVAELGGDAPERHGIENVTGRVSPADPTPSRDKTPEAA